MRRYLLLLIALLIFPPSLPAQPVDMEEQVRRIASELRCVVCQNLSVADSPSELAQQMRGVIREQLKEGKSPEGIKAYFVSKYGEWVLLAPTPKGFSLLLWVLPYVAVIAGIVLVIFIVRRWTYKRKTPPPQTVDPALIERVQRDVAAEQSFEVDPEAESPHAPLLQEQARLYADLKELEFDYQAGKLSEADYRDLRYSLEAQAAAILKDLESSTPSRSDAQTRTAKAKEATPEKKAAETGKAGQQRWQAWQLAVGGAFLLIFGITLGIFLTQSLRPRGSQEDSITGDFLTGTGAGGITSSSGKEIPSLLAQGRAAYQRQEWPQAIEAYKRALAIDPNLPEAHTHMGLILAQAGHADGALSAFEQALSIDPNYPLALWGKGMLLYRAKEDLAGARRTLERLVSILPPGADRDEIQKTIAELVALGSQQKEGSKKAKLEAALGQIQGTISIDPKFKTKVGGQAVLFIIARSANSPGGPPLAVKKVDRPVFPLSYSLSSENVMMPGVSFSGKVHISARLDKDGNPVTREVGNLMGEYKKNPVEIGVQKIDIVIDRIM